MKAIQTTATQTRVHVQTNQATVSDTMSTAVLAVSTAAALAVALWSFAALISGLIGSGGPTGLAGGFFRAVSGL